MYSTPQWALPFAAHCRSRLKLAEAVALAALPSADVRSAQSFAARRARARLHAACWVHRRDRGLA